MPQGRNKLPFSGKAKKNQMKNKRLAKSNRNEAGPSRSKNFLLKANSDDDSTDDDTVQKLNSQPSKVERNRYVLQFYKESDKEILERKEKARQALKPISSKELEINIDNYFNEEYDFPKRPKWSYNMSKHELDAREHRYFTEYLMNLEEKVGKSNLTYFELNLETWRQLWRVLELSDVVLIIVDIRFPALMFPPSLYDYVTNTLKKHMIIILNKIDLAPTPLVVAWKHYFEQKYPSLKVILFTSVPDYNLMGNRSDKAGLQIRKRKGRIRMAAEGTKLILNTCKEFVGDQVDLSSWEEKIDRESMEEFDDGDNKVIAEETIYTVKPDTGYFEHVKFKDGKLCIGCIGQPNVGKSSLMNAIMGKKVVSVSKTPGHTKHFQTIYLTKNVVLCDCPGLVFPSKVPKVMQILMGSFPIAQLREPFTSVQYLGERLDLPKLLRIPHPENDDTWSAMDICDGWAKKRGFLTAKTARLDSYRAANNILRMALEGKICLCLTPPDYADSQEKWLNHPDANLVRHIKAITEDVVTQEPNLQVNSDDTESDDSTSKEAGCDTKVSDEDSDTSLNCAAKNKFSALNDSDDD